MAAFRYVAVTRAGETVTGTRDAADRQAVIDWLAGQHYLPLRAEPVGTGLTLKRGSRGLRRKRLAHLTRELATLLEAGLAIDRALELLARLGSPAEAALVRRLLAALRDGQALSQAMAAEPASFTADYVAVVRAGEAGATLPAVLGRLAAGLERATAVREQVRSALIYPGFLAVAAIGSVILLMTLVVPSFEPLFEQAGRDLPASTRLLLATSQAMQAWAVPGLLLLAVLVLILGRLPADSAPRHRLDRLVLRLPLVGRLVAAIEAARFCRTLGMLLGNGVGLLQALELALPALTNRGFRTGVSAATEAVKSGGRLGGHLALIRGWPPLAAELAAVGEETARLPDMLLKAAETLETDSARTVERLIAALTPTLTLLLGLMVAGIVISLLSAVMAVNDLAL